MKNHAYVISERNRKVAYFDLTDKTSCALIEYDNGDFEPGTIYTWVKPVFDFTYASIEKLTKNFGKEDVIISSDLILPEICQRLNEPEYDRWNTSFDVCSKMLEAYSKITETETISLEDLIKAMQQ